MQSGCAIALTPGSDTREKTGPRSQAAPCAPGAQRTKPAPGTEPRAVPVAAPGPPTAAFSAAFGAARAARTSIPAAMTVRAGGRAGLPGAVALRTRILHCHVHAVDPGIVLPIRALCRRVRFSGRSRAIPPGRGRSLEPENSVRGANARERGGRGSPSRRPGTANSKGGTAMFGTDYRPRRNPDRQRPARRDRAQPRRRSGRHRR